MLEQRLFRLAADALAVTGSVDGFGRWRLRVAVKHSGESWDEADVAVYELLTTPEMLDALGAAVDRAVAL